MELFVVDHGDSYDRFTVGVARSLDEARDMARSYRASQPYTFPSFYFFGVTRHEAGVMGGSDREELILD